MKPNNVLYRPCNEDSFFRLWMEILTPFHHLTARERDVAARLLAQYFKLRNNVAQPELLWELLWSQSSRKEMRESLGMSQAHFQMVLAKLRSVKFLDGECINPRFIPHMGEDRIFCLQVVFDWRENAVKMR